MKYTHPKHLQFIKDMEYHTELEVRHYKGRYWWQGPAVSVEYLEDALDHTQVPCQWDQLGLGYIVYPMQGMQSADPDKHRDIQPVEHNDYGT